MRWNIYDLFFRSNNECCQSENSPGWLQLAFRGDSHTTCITFWSSKKVKLGQLLDSNHNNKGPEPCWRLCNAVGNHSGAISCGHVWMEWSVIKCFELLADWKSAKEMRDHLPFTPIKTVMAQSWTAVPLSDSLAYPRTLRHNRIDQWTKWEKNEIFSLNQGGGHQPMLLPWELLTSFQLTSR